jgi:hypothetical protein
MSTTIHRPVRGVGSGGTTRPRTQGELRSTLGFTTPLEGRAPEMLSKWFYDTSTDTVTRAAHCSSLLEGLRLSYAQAK